MSTPQEPPARFWRFVRKNGFSIFLGMAVVVMLVSPDAKSWVLRQLMRTGVFNARIESKVPGDASQTAIDFDFQDEQGRIQNTSSLRGKVVFINFWASWCPPCRAEFPSIETFYSKFKNHTDVFFLTINEDNELSAAKDFLSKERYSIPLYRTHGSVPREIYSGSLPTTVVLDKAGNVRFHHEGFANYAAEKFVKQVGELIKE